MPRRYSWASAPSALTTSGDFMVPYDITMIIVTSTGRNGIRDFPYAPAMRTIIPRLLCLGMLAAAMPGYGCSDKFRVGSLDLTKVSVEDLGAALAQKKVTSAQLVDAYLARI